MLFLGSMADPVLNHLSTLEDVKRVYFETEQWRRTGDPTLANLHLEAINRLLAFRPSRATHGGRGAEEIVFDTEALREERKLLLEFIDVGDADDGVSYLDFSEYRS
jgi:hypothetical protein